MVDFIKAVDRAIQDPGHTVEIFKNMDYEDQKMTLLKVALVAIAAGLLAGVLLHLAVGVISAAVVAGVILAVPGGLLAFAYVTDAHAQYHSIGGIAKHASENAKHTLNKAERALNQAGNKVKKWADKL